MKKKSSPVDWDKTDLVTCVDLNHTTPISNEFEEVYHFLYASQVYQTLFAVYGKFDFSVKDLKVKGVDLQLLNYNGLMNVGFCDVETNDIPNTRKTEDFYFGVQGGSNKRSIYLEVTDPAGNPTEIQLTKGKHTRIVFSRILYKLLNFNPADVNSVWFDTEFHSRSGTEYYDNNLHPGMAGNKWVSSPRCRESYVNLIYH
ncbi:MAG: hypothetical protein JST69_01480 [Bacteroidetes bacterium]|nr:hypothetical protein [Bacteroidota bacterium]